MFGLFSELKEQLITVAFTYHLAKFCGYRIDYAH